MPRSPAEGAATRSVADLEISPAEASRDRRVRSGVDRRQRNVGPPDGIERRRVERRSHDRRTTGLRGDRRSAERRGTQNRRAAADHRVAQARRMQAARVASRSYNPEAFTTSRTPRMLRVVIITIVAVACLLAATLTGPVKRAGAAAKPKTTAGTVKAKADGVTATLSYQRRTSSSFKVYGTLRLTVRAKGRKTLRAVRLRGAASESWLTRPSLKLVDVTGDGVPDPVIGSYTGGAHCCSISTVAPSTTRGWAKPIVRDWADNGFKLEDLGGTPQVEFRGRDSRFTGAYGPYAVSYSPLQIMRLQEREFVDVTREFPEWIKADAAEHAKAWQDAAKEDADIRAQVGRIAGAAWVADLLLLGDTAGAKAVVDASAARGDFADEAGALFTGQFGHDLKAWGYLTDPALIGLTDSPAPVGGDGAGA